LGNVETDGNGVAKIDFKGELSDVQPGNAVESTLNQVTDPVVVLTALQTTT